MKNRILKTLTSLVLVAMMVATLIPAMLVGTFAADYEKATELTANGTYVITYTTKNGDFAASAYTASNPSKWVNRVAKDSGWTLTDGIVATENAALTWEISEIDVEGTIYYTIKNLSDNKYLKWTANTNGIAVVDTANANCYWNAVFAADGTVQFFSTDGTVKLADNVSASGIRAYKIATVDNNTSGGYVSGFVLYKAATGGACDEGHTDVEPADCVCDVCGSNIPHDWVDDSVVTPAGCMTEGSMSQKCSVCGTASEVTVVIPATGHNFVGGKCTACGEKELASFNKYTDAIVPGAYIIVANDGAVNTTVNSGRLQYDAVTVAGDAIKPINGIIVWDFVKVVIGEVEYYTIQNRETGEYMVSTGAKNKADVKEYADAAAASADDKALWIVTGGEEATIVNKYNSENSINSTLRRNDSYGFACYGDSTGVLPTLYKAPEDAPAAPSISTWSISLRGDIGVNLYYTVDEAWLAENAGAKIVALIGGNEIASYDITAAGRLAVRCAVAPTQLNETITLNVVTADGTTVATETAKVGDYKAKVEAKYNADTLAKYDELIAILDALEIYGQAAAGYKTGAAADVAVDKTAFDNFLYSYSGVNTFYNTTFESALKFDSITATLDSTCALNIYFQAMPEGMTYSDYQLTLLKGEDITNLEFVFENHDLSRYMDETRECLTIGGLLVTDFDTILRVRVANGIYAGSVDISMLRCIAALGKSDAYATDANLQNLLASLYNYYKATEAYFA